MGVVAGGGAESQDQEVRAQRCRRELGEEERPDIDEERVLYSYSNTVFVAHLSERRSTAVVRGDPKRSIGGSPMDVLSEKYEFIKEKHHAGP